MTFDAACGKQWMIAMNKTVQEKKDVLTELDQAVGDGDHGLNMARGFQEVVNKIDANEYEDLGSFFSEVGMTLISTVGGASGPLYGTAFIKLAAQLKGRKQADLPVLAAAFSAALEGIKARGRAEAGDKTMVDVWEPIVTHLLKRGELLQVEELTRLAQEKLEETKNLHAKKGRAAYLGKRSIGHLDPGAASSVYLFTAFADVLKGEIDNEQS